MLRRHLASSDVDTTFTGCENLKERRLTLRLVQVPTPGRFIALNDHIPGDTPALVVNPSKVLTDYSDRYELNRSQEGNHNDNRGPTLNGLPGSQC